MREVAQGSNAAAHEGRLAPPAPCRRPARTAAAFTTGALAGALVLGACGIHVSKNGISGNIDGHSFSASKGSLPQGFPSDVPTPDSATVLAGGGTGDAHGSGYDAAFSVPGSATSVMTAYEAKFTSAGYKLSGVLTPESAGAAGATTSTTEQGGVFTATGSQWTVEVELGSSSSSNADVKAGNTALNIIVASNSLVTTSTT